MHASDIDTQRPDRGKRYSRRLFFAGLVAAFGGFTAWQVTDKGAGSAAPSAERVHSSATPVLPGYLVPHYLPTGYQLVAQYTDRPDGFGGQPELALWYRNQTNGPMDPDSFINPLAIYETRAPQRKELGTMQQHAGTDVTLTRNANQRSPAVCFDGQWMLPQGRQSSVQSTPLVCDTSNIHALVFTIGTLTIGVRGSRVAGITYDELVRVANSLA